MKQRIITGVILLLVAFLWLFFPSLGNRYLPIMVFDIGAIIIAIVSAYEFAQFIFKKTEGSVYTIKRALYAFSVFVIISLMSRIEVIDFSPSVALDWARPHDIFRNLEPTTIGIMLASFVWWVVSVFLVIFYPSSGRILKSSILKAILGYLTIIPCYIAMVILRVQGHDGDYIGSVVLVSVMILVWCTDSGAYFVGKALGKHKMSPHVSPNKTIEGLAGGLVVAMIAFGILAYFGAYGHGYQSNLLSLSISAIITIVISVFGDLMESLFKREAGIKDSGVIFPGHGGMLDRVDSLSASIPVFVVSNALLSLVF